MAIGGSDVLKLIVQADTGQAVREFKSLGTSAEQSFRNIEQKSMSLKDKVSSNVSNAFKSLTTSLSSPAAGAAIAAGFGAIVKSTVDAASALNEQVSKTKAVFGSSADSILDWSKKSATSFGQSQRAALEAASSFGNMFLQLGIGRQQAVGMSEKLTVLASDFASFFNTNPADAIDAITSAFRGEYDAVQKFVPTINAAAVQQEAMAETGKTNAKSLTDQEKALAAYTLILEGAGKATGDFQRTSDGLANQQRILAANFENLKAQIGEAFIPAMTQATDAVNKFIDVANKVTAPIGGISEAVSMLLRNIPGLAALNIMNDVTADGVSTWGKFKNVAGDVVPILNAIPGLHRESAKAAQEDAAAMGLVANGVDLVSSALTDQSHRLAEGAEQIAEWGQLGVDASAKVANGVDLVGGALHEVASAWDRNLEAARSTQDAYEDLTKATNDMIDAQLAAVDHNLAQREALRDVADASDEYNKSLMEQADKSTTAAQVARHQEEAQDKLIESSLKAAAAAKQHAIDTGNANGANKAFTDTLRFIAANAAPGVRAELLKVADGLDAVDKTVHPRVSAVIETGNLQSLETRLQHLARGFVVPVSVRGSPGGGGIRIFQQGGAVPGGRNDAVPAIVHGGEYVLSADVVDRIKKGRKSEGAMMPLGLPALSLPAQRGTTGGTSVVINFNTPIDPVAAGREVKRVLAAADRAGVR